MTEVYELTEDQTEQIATAVNYYLQSQYRRITDIYAVIENRTLITEGIWAYPCPCQTIYLDDNAHPVNYGRQIVSSTYYDSNGEIILDDDGTVLQEEPGEYDHVDRKVYYDTREKLIPFDPDLDADQSIYGALVYLGDYDWSRDKSGGGGIVG